MRPPSAMPWPSSAVNSGPRRLSPPPRITETYRNSQPTCSTAFWPSPADRPDLQSQAQGRKRITMNVCGLQLRGQEVRMWRGQIKTIVLTGAVSAMLTAGFAAPSEALTPPVRSIESIAGAGPAEPVYYGWYYRRRHNPARALV